MSLDFEVMVRQKFDEFMSLKGFQFDRLISDSVGAKSAVLYVSTKQKMAIYRSLRDGEVNCLVGAKGADVARLDDGKEWAYMSSIFQRGQEMSMEELLARVPSTPKGTAEQLSEIASVLRQRFDELVAD